MFKTSGRRKKKTTAQAMVEFALALPVLLLVVYGLIETGRLIFIYASAVTAARNAVRYGSATGNNGSGTPYYQDCDGIKAAANNVAFINPLSSIQITYDAGLDTSGNPTKINGSFPLCPLPASALQNGQVPNGWRINVSVSSQYSPIVPLVPFGPFTITSMSSRTLLGSVSIGVTAPPQTWTGSGGINLQVTTNPSTYSDTTHAITFYYIITNTSTSTITAPKVTDSLVTNISCLGSSISAGGSITCTGTYTPTQADLDNGSISSVATASAILTINGTSTTVVSNTVNTTLYATQKPSLSLTKTASVSAAIPGTKISYTYTITNTGNVTLSSIATTDNRLGSVCSGSSLAPGAKLPCTVPYTITTADGNAGAVTNTAQATATFGTICPTSNPCKSNTASATIATKPLYLSITTSPLIVNGGVGQTIQYTYYLTNETNTVMPPSFAVADSKVNPVTCPNGSSLGGGKTLQCSGSYVTTQADVDTGIVTSTATASANSGAITSNTVTISIIVTQTPGITLTVSASPSIATTVGQVIAYTYTITNSGNVTLKAPFSVSDNKVTSLDCSKTTSPLPPGASTTCAGSYAITQADIDAGSVIDQATASGLMLVSGQTVTSAQASATIITYNAPRLTLQKTASPTLANSAGQVVTYTYTLKNTGNTPLLSPFTVTDNKIGSANCSTAVSPIPIGGFTTCTANYTVTSADITAGSVTNIANATAMVQGTNTTLTSNQATATVQTGAIACDPRHSSLKTSPFSMTIFNESASATITISQIQIYFNTNPTGQFISTMQYGGITIWAGATTGSPGVFTTFTGDVTLQAGKNKLLGLTFNKNYIANGSEQIVVTFAESGCPVLDSTNNNQLP